MSSKSVNNFFELLCKETNTQMHTVSYITSLVEVNSKNTFYCATIAYHVELNADLGWPQAPANVQEK